MTLYEQIRQDVRYREGLNACINRGTCAAICPAAAVFNYDSGLIAETLQNGDKQDLENLLRSDTTWYCGEGSSCKTLCPRDNTPGLLIQALRHLSQTTGYSTGSAHGHQQLAVKRTVGTWIPEKGYCLVAKNKPLEMNPEQGPVWQWLLHNAPESVNRMGANYKEEGAGPMRAIVPEALEELKAFFDVTGGTQLYETIGAFSAKKAEAMNLQFDQTNVCEYFRHGYTANEKTHSHL